MSGLYTSRGQQGAPVRSTTVQPDYAVQPVQQPVHTAGAHTPATPLRTGLGAFAHAGPVFRLTPAPAMIQRFPYKYEHTRLHRTFHLTNSGGKLQMDEVGHNLDPYSGYAEYEIKDDALVLKHIQSDPETGSGIGSLLVYHLGHLAEDQGLTHVVISMPAIPAVGFYETVGAQAPARDAAAEQERRYAASDGIAEWARDRHIHHMAKVTYNANRDNRIANRKFDQLETEEQEKLVAEQAHAFDTLSEVAQRKTVGEWIHARAVAGQGEMVASPGTILARTTASVNDKWREQALDRRTRDGLLGKNLVTLVSTARKKYIDESGVFSRTSKQTLDAIEVLGTLVHDYDNMADAVPWYLGLGPAPHGVAVTEKLKQGSRFQTLLLAAWQEYTG